MKLNKLFFKSSYALPLVFVVACNGGGGGNDMPLNATILDPSLPTSGLPNGGSVSGGTGQNVMSFTVNGSDCASDSYQDKPCVSITICDQATGATCVTVDDILLDTGSNGLRIFKAALLPTFNPYTRFTQISQGAGTSLVECARFGDDTIDWGPVMQGKMILANEPIVSVPIQVIDRSFANYTGGVCQSSGGNPPEADPSAAKLNGILGVGLFGPDCGGDCATSLNRTYYDCNNTTHNCVRAITPLANQVTNPIAKLPIDNNGAIFRLPTVPSAGAVSAQGYMIMGIGTRDGSDSNFTNNVPTGVIAYPAEKPQTGFAQFRTTFNSQVYTESFLDTGSNGLYFPSPGSSALPDCGGSLSGYYCPDPQASFATIIASGLFPYSPATNVIFSIHAADDLFQPQAVFNDIGASTGPSGAFDWGLPFFLGRNVYVGIDGTTDQSSTLSAPGPYWAF